jgi:signal peptidase
MRKQKTVREVLKSTTRIILLVFAALTVGLNIYTVNALRIGGNAVPMPFGVGAAVVLSGSMEPELSVGDLLIVLDSSSYEIGDVVVYQDGNIAVTHRIVRFSDEEEIVTQGDANNTEDDPISVEAIKGEVVAVIPFIGYVINAIKTPIVTICILALAVFLLERSFRAEKKTDNEKLDSIKAEIERLKQQQKDR